MWAYLSVGLVTMVLCGYQYHHGMREKDIYNIELLRIDNGRWGGWRGGEGGQPEVAQILR